MFHAGQIQLIALVVWSKVWMLFQFKEYIEAYKLKSENMNVWKIQIVKLWMI